MNYLVKMAEPWESMILNGKTLSLSDNQLRRLSEYLDKLYPEANGIPGNAQQVKNRIRAAISDGRGMIIPSSELRWYGQVIPNLQHKVPTNGKLIRRVSDPVQMRDALSSVALLEETNPLVQAETNVNQLSKALKNSSNKVTELIEKNKALGEQLTEQTSIANSPFKSFKKYLFEPTKTEFKFLGDSPNLQKFVRQYGRRAGIIGGAALGILGLGSMLGSEKQKSFFGELL